MVADAVAATADVTVDSSNVDTYVTDISAQITDELAQLTASTDCLGKGTGGGTPNANWVKVCSTIFKKFQPLFQARRLLRRETNKLGTSRLLRAFDDE